MEVVFDLDTEAQARARDLGLRMVRTPTASNHPGYVEMMRELIAERLDGTARATVGDSPRPAGRLRARLLPADGLTRYSRAPAAISLSTTSWCLPRRAWSSAERPSRSRRSILGLPEKRIESTVD